MATLSEERFEIRDSSLPNQSPTRPREYNMSLKLISKYSTVWLALLLAMLSAAAYAADPSEQELIATLRSGQPEEKALACKKLAIYGTKECVPDLATLLSDAHLASWARIALEAIPDPAAD